MIHVADIQCVSDLAKRYLVERRKYERLSEKSHTAATPKQNQKANVDLNWQAMELSKIEAALHAACVDADLADLREPSAYDDREFRPSGWHIYNFSPPKPRSLIAHLAAKRDFG